MQIYYICIFFFVYFFQLLCYNCSYMRLCYILWEVNIMTQYEMIIDLSKRVRRLEEDMVKMKNQTMSIQDCGVSTKEQHKFDALILSDNTDKALHSENVIVDTSFVENSMQKQSVVRKESSNKSTSDFENKIGKNLMGIAAAILIFSSLILFGGLLFTHITDGVKFFIMMGISVVALILGLIQMNNDSKYHVLFSSIAGIGAGGFYITCLIGYFGFGFLNDIVLILCLSSWLLFTTILSRYKSKMFLYISNIGLLVATMLVCMNWPKFYVGIILYFIGFILLYFCNKTYDYKNDFLFVLQMPVVSFFLCSLYRDFIVCFVLILLVSLFYIFQLFKYQLFHGKYKGFTICSLIVTMIFQFSMIWFSNIKLSYGLYDLNKSILVLLLYVALGCYGFIIYTKYNDDNKYIWNVWSCCFTIVVVLSHWTVLRELDFGLNISAFWLFFLLFVFIGFLQDNKLIRGLGYSFFYISLIYSVFDSTICDNIIYSVIVCVIAVVSIAILFIWLLHHYSRFDKYYMISFVFCFIFYSANICITQSWIVLLEFSLLSILLNTKIFRYSLSNEFEPSSAIIGYVVNVLMMLFLSINLYSTDSLIYMIINILCLIGVYCVNVTHIFEIGLSEHMSGLYVSLKFTILLYVLLSFFNTVSFIASILFVLFAIACVIVGFKFQQKSFRVYGLILTLFSVIKLILFDIEYGSNIVRPIGFFVAGILCLVISWIYARLEKQLITNNIDDLDK